MDINNKINKQVEEYLNSKIIDTNSVYGGCIANSKIIKMQNGNTYFLKMLDKNSQILKKEANGLSEIAKSKSIYTPKIINADTNFLLLEYIEQGVKSIDFFKVFGKKLAQMHKYTATEFGFYEDNYIGLSPQYNIAENSEKHEWAEFYTKKRLLPQLQMAKKNRFVTTELQKVIHHVVDKTYTILEYSKEPPTLLHGDLWGGNYLCSKNNSAVLIDPAVYYGHREADLAMTKMFGGFSPEFYTAYQQVYPLAEGWQDRQNLYLLYHNLNHLNLFGNSYYSSCVYLAKSLIDKH